jgi:hypothetical protein
MTRTEANDVVASCIVRGKFSREKAQSLGREVKRNAMAALSKAGERVPSAFVIDLTCINWLACCGYLYERVDEKTGMACRCTASQR